MRALNHIFTGNSNLESFFIHNPEICKRNTLLQIFTGIMDEKIVEAILSTVRKCAPDIYIIGASSYGEIFSGKINHEKILLSFSIFEKTEIETFYCEEASFRNGADTASALIRDNTRCMILFSEALQTNAVEFLNGVSSVKPNIIVAGGNAGDSGTFSKTFIINKDGVQTKGVTGAVLNSDVLQIHNEYALNWHPFGKKLTITKVEANKIVELDGKPIIEFVKHYFGEEAVSNLPASIIEFPLLREVEDTLVARSVIAADETGLLYAGDMPVGDSVRFGIGDIEDMHNNAVVTSEKLLKHPVEAIYAYSCAGRLSFLRNSLSVEFELLESIANTAGFFTYGEFYHTGHTSQMLNLTTTLLTLSESETTPAVKLPEIKPAGSDSQMLRYLTNFINRMTGELEENLNSLQNYKDILDESTIVTKTDYEGRITYANEAFLNIMEYTMDEVIGKPHSIVKHPDTAKEIHQMMWNTLKAKKVWKGIIRNRTKSGETVYLDTIIIPLLNKAGGITEFMSIRHNMTKVIKQEQLINEQFTDSLTKLPNRVKLFSDLQNSDITHLAILNIDGFKGINDLYGFNIADQFLIQITKYISSKLNNNMAQYRLGGDEFVISCSGCTNSLFKDKIINIITDVKKFTFHHGEYDIDISLSAGIAHDTDRLLTSAEVALRNARRDGLMISTITKDSPEANIYIENTMWLKRVKDALASGNIINYYQPIHCIQKQEQKKYEALVRLRDNEGNIHSPFAFLDLVKQTAEYEHITRAVISNVIEECGRHPDTRFTINLAAQDISNSTTMEYLRYMISGGDIASRLTLELTESEALVDYTSVIKFVEDFKALGCKIAIDDFGSGYSNFAYLAQFDVDYLKIDGSIVKRILDDRNSLITLESILDFARRLEIETIAEFVSSEAIYNKVVELGVSCVQGYHLGKPEPLS